MDQVWIPLLSALGGALIGSLSSIITIVVRSRFEDRMNRVRLAVEAGLQEHRAALDLAKLNPGRSQVWPLITFIYSNLKNIELMSDGKLDKENLSKQNEEFKTIVEMFRV